MGYDNPLQNEYEGFRQRAARIEGNWCDDCHGYTHMPYCPSYENPSNEQPAGTPVSEWSYNYDGDRYHIRAAGNDDCVAHADKLKDAEQIVEDHNRRLRGERQQPVITGTEDGNTDEWRVDDYEINDGKRSIVRAPHPDEFPGLTQPQRDRVAKASRKNLATIVSDHNQHQHCAAQLRFLGDRLEAQAEMMSKVVAERNELREQNERLREALRNAKRCLERPDRSQLSVRKAVEKADAALNHAEQGEG